MGELILREATENDLPFIKKMYAENKSILGNYYFEWENYKKRGGQKNRWCIINEVVGFVHYSLSKKYNSWIINDIAIGKDFKRMGYGRAVISVLPRPLMLKTDADNEESNSFYKGTGFVLVGKSNSKNGSKIFNLYSIY